MEYILYQKIKNYNNGVKFPVVAEKLTYANKTMGNKVAGDERNYCVTDNVHLRLLQCRYS